MRRTEDRTSVIKFARALEEILARVFVCAFERPRHVAVAFSGGLDSCVLLHLLSHYAKTDALVIHAFHIHHGLSPRADEWLEHCRKVAGLNGAIFDACHVVLDPNDRRGVEGAARAKRYAALGDLCRRYGIGLLLTAHHRNDQAETVLLQMMRGAGLPGLAGMPVCHADHPLLGGRVVLGRPLLGIDRSALEQEALQSGLTYVDDESNADWRFRRNALRLGVVPLLEQSAPGCTAAIARVASHAQTAMHLLDDLADIDLAACRIDDSALALDIGRLKVLPLRRIANVLRRWLRLHGVTPPSASALDGLCRQMLMAAQDAQPVFDIGTMQLCRFRNELRLSSKPPNAPPPVEVAWTGEPVLECLQWRGRLLFQRAQQGLPLRLLQENPLRLSARMGAEKLKPALNRPAKSLKKLYQEMALSPWQRQQLPLLYAGPHLVFAAGIGINMHHVVEGECVRLRWESLHEQHCRPAGLR
jgi:tRNA(Ile)-lysidine synthase